MPEAVKGLVMWGGAPAAPIVRTNVLVSVPTELSAVRTILYTPAAATVPEIVCVLLLKVRPEGRVPVVYVMGLLPLAVITYGVMARPAVPAAVRALVISGAIGFEQLGIGTLIVQKVT